MLASGSGQSSRPGLGFEVPVQAEAGPIRDSGRYFGTWRAMLRRKRDANLEVVGVGCRVYLRWAGDDCAV